MKINPIHLMNNARSEGFDLELKTNGGKEVYVITERGSMMFNGTLKEVNIWLGAWTRATDRASRLRHAA